MLHRDVKPANLLLEPRTGRLKLCDFGLARLRRPGLGAGPLQGSAHICSRWYRAPELLLAEAYGEGVDLWSAGCILAELLRGGRV